MKLNMISNYKPSGSSQSILIPTLRSKNTYYMQNANPLASAVVHYPYMHFILLFMVGLVKMLMFLTLQISGGKECFCLNSIIKVVVVFIVADNRWK